MSGPAVGDRFDVVMLRDFRWRETVVVARVGFRAYCTDHETDCFEAEFTTGSLRGVRMTLRVSDWSNYSWGPA